MKITRIMKTIICIFALTVITLCLFSCDVPSVEKMHKVGVAFPSGVIIDGENPRYVKDGEDAVFNITLPSGYILSSSGGAEYDRLTGTLTVKNVTKRTYIEVLIEKYQYDPNETFAYLFSSDNGLDSSDVKNGGSIPSGTRINVSANDESRAFLGWTAGKSFHNGGELLSRDRVFSFLLTPDICTDGILRLFPNYVDANTVYYYPNGGEYHKDSENLSHTGYYSVNEYSSCISLLYSATYTSYMECAPTFYDDGSFTREGYVLKEYNTMPDGSGRAYSLGSKVPFMLDGSAPTLYCIWAKDTEHSLFDYEEITIDYPFSRAQTAPHWVENGIIITNYKGDAEEVVIPEMIDGKYVIAVAEGTFKNKRMHTLVLSRRLIRVENGAVQGCDSLTTLYYPDGMYDMDNEALDSASYKNLKNFYVNATIAPRYTSADTGAFATKLSRLLASESENRIIFIAGSSSYQGLTTDYLEALLEGGYRVVNFGTTRTTNCQIYLEAMGTLAHSGDVIIYAPENSSYMFGERELYWKTLRDLESMNNIFRHIDISGYTNVLGAFRDFNRSYRYNEGSSSGTPKRYEDIAVHGSLQRTDGKYPSLTTSKYGDILYDIRATLSTRYNSAYFVTLNNRVKSKHEGAWNNTQDQIANKDYTDLSNITWASIDDSYYSDSLNRAILSAKSSGASVYFGFCPVDADSLVEGADSILWLREYEALIAETYEFDGLLGNVENYIYKHEYFYDCAFHLNDVGRSFRTYRVYLDLCDILSISEIAGYTEIGTDFDGLIFEGESGVPNDPWTPKYN